MVNKNRGGRDIVTFREPKFKPMPGELTPAVISGATLPVKVEAAKRAIAACCDLSELLTWKDKLAALAAAAKMAKMPELSRDVNRVHKEAIFRMGEILLQYKGKQYSVGIKRTEKGPSERSNVQTQLGIPAWVGASAVRLAASPAEVRARVLTDDSITPNLVRMVRHAPPRLNNKRGIALSYSDAARAFFSGISDVTHTRNQAGLSQSVAALRKTPLDLIPQLTAKEKQHARKIVVEMQEILDEIDRRLGPA